MSEAKKPGSFEEFDARLNKARPEKRGAADGGEDPPPRLDYGSGLQAGIEVVAGVGLVRCWAGRSIGGWGRCPCS